MAKPSSEHRELKCAAGINLPRVSVLMPVRQEGLRFARILAAVAQQDYPCLDRIVIAVGPSHDSTCELAAELGHADTRVHLVENPQGIVSTGLNLAMRLVDSEYVVRIDGHCLVPLDFISRLVETSVKVNAACVGPRLRTVGTSTTQRAIAAAMSSRLGVGGSRFRIGASSGFVDTVPFGLYRRELLERIGGFREELVRNQDDELNSRIRRAGGRIYLAADVCVDYYPRSSLSQLWRQYFEYGYWRMITARQFGDRLRPRQVAPAAFVAVTAVTGARAAAGRSRLLLLLATSYATTLGFLSAQTLLRTRSASIALRSVAAGAALHLAYGLGMWVSFLRLSNLWRVLRNSSDPS